MAFALIAGTGGFAAERKPSVEALDPRLPGFIKAKEQQARELAEALKIKVSPDVWKGFDLFGKGNWQQASNHFAAMMRRNGQYEGATNDAGIHTPVWQPLMEVDLVCGQFAFGEPKYARAFGDDIIASIPKGSIYFGGTDPGRGLVTGLIRSHIQGDPFFVITQNALADASYLTYLREMYGHKIYVPTESDLQKAFQGYMAEARERVQKHQLKPGEDVRFVDNRVQVSGTVAVMSINALLAKMIFDQNPEREFYLEESFPLDWMYPYLAPNGLILKVERRPLPELAEDVIQRDTEFWKQYCGRLIGDWLEEETPVAKVAEFALKVYVRHDLSGFKGDPAFVRSDMARKAFSKLRSSQGGVYQWRFQNAKSPAERERMRRAADLAFRQALALCPDSPEAVFRYCSLLVASDGLKEALQVAYACLKMDPNNQQVSALAKQLEEQRRPHGPAAQGDPK